MFFYHTQNHSPGNNAGASSRFKLGQDVIGGKHFPAVRHIPAPLYVAFAGDSEYVLQVGAVRSYCYENEQGNEEHAKQDNEDKFIAVFLPVG